MRNLIITIAIGCTLFTAGYGTATLYKNSTGLKEATLSPEMVTIRTAAERNGITYGTDDWYILLAIRKAENGSAGKEFGIMHPKADNLDKQAGWCAASIVKNRERWDGTGDFVEFMGRRYCPPEAHPLNKNWVGNVNYWKDKLKGGV